MAQRCDTCLFQGPSKSTDQGVQIVCLYHEGKRFKDTDLCDNYKIYIAMPSSEVMNLIRDDKNRIETQKRHQETVAVAKEANDISRSAKKAAWCAFLISIFSIIISVAVAIWKK